MRVSTFNVVHICYKVAKYVQDYFLKSEAQIVETIMLNMQERIDLDKQKLALPIVSLNL